MPKWPFNLPRQARDKHSTGKSRADLLDRQDVALHETVPGSEKLVPSGACRNYSSVFSIDLSCVGPEPVLANIRVLRIKWHRKEERFRTSGGGAPVVGRNRRSQTVGVVGRIQKILDERQRCAVDELGPDGDDRRVVFRDFRLQKTPFFSIFPMLVPSLSW